MATAEVKETAAMLCSVAVFLLSLAIGLAYPIPLEEVEKQVSTVIETATYARDPLSLTLGLLSAILYNNVGVAVRCVVLGPTLVYPLYVLYANGYTIGSVVSYVGVRSLVLIPHGVLELPAIVYSGYVGSRLGLAVALSIARRALGREAGSALLREFLRSFRDLRLAILFLAAAAVVEVFVSLPLSYILS